MRFLAFLLLGTIIFGFAFPAFILLFGFFAFVIKAAIVISALRGGSFRVYTNRDFGQRRQSPPDDPEVLEPHEDQYSDEPEYEEPREEEGQTDEDDGEVVELPASALHKDDEEDKQDDARQQ